MGNKYDLQTIRFPLWVFGTNIGTSEFNRRISLNQKLYECNPIYVNLNSFLLTILKRGISV